MRNSISQPSQSPGRCASYKSPPTMKRKIFLEAFLEVLGAKEIIWTEFQIDKVFGTVLYDPNDYEERQDFVWHMTESNTPTGDIINLLNFLSLNSLVVSDKIIIPLKEIKIDAIDNNNLDKLYSELLSIEVSMIDNGEETDKYFIHN